MPSRYQKFLIFIFDLCAVTFAWAFSFLLRYNFSIPSQDLFGLYNSIPITLLVNSIAFYFFRIYRPTWRYITLEDLRDLVLTIFFGLLVIALFILMFKLLIPRSVLIIYPCISIILLGEKSYII